MNFIYCIVSGVVMELLQFILTFLSKNFNLDVLAPFFELAKNGNFSFENIVKNLDFNKLAPVINAIFSSLNKQSPTETVGHNFYGLNPIANLADKEIVYTLNKFLSQPNLT